MKKIRNQLAFVLCLVSLLGFSACSNAMVNDGNNVRSYVKHTPSGEEDGGAAPFSLYNNIMDFQIWSNDGAGCTAITQDEALVIAQTGGWYGLAICSDKAGNDSSDSYKIYNFEQISKITFEAKANRDGTKIKVGPCTEDLKEYELTQEYQTFTYDMSQANHAKTGNHYCILALVGEAAGVTHFVKNIAFFDGAGAETVPELVQ